MINNDDEGIREAARAIRPYLNDLVGPANAESFDRRISDQLTGRGDQTAIAVRLRTIFEEQPDTAWFLSRVLADKPYYRPPYHQSSYQRGIVSPPGDPGVVHADRYACPRGDYVLVPTRHRRPCPGMPDSRLQTN